MELLETKNVGYEQHTRLDTVEKKIYEKVIIGAIQNETHRKRLKK